jgi:putative ABC transport system permease protein
MSRERPLFRRLLPPGVADQLNQELDTHQALLTDDYQRRGMTSADARRAAQARMGDVGRARTECVSVGRKRERRVLRSALLDHLVQDLRFGVRNLWHHKGWAGVALLTLALGIGACTAVFSVVNSLLLHPLPYPGADRVVLLYESPLTSGGVTVWVGPQADALRAWRAGARSFENIEPYTVTDATWAIGTTSDVAHVARITPGFLGFAGERLVRGRNFTAAEATGRQRVVLVSESFWHNQLQRDPQVVGRSLRLDGDEYTIIGVAPRTLTVPLRAAAATDLWLSLDPNEMSGLAAVGRLRPGVSVTAGEHDLDAAATAAGVRSAKAFRAMALPPTTLVSFRAALRLLAVAVVLVLLIACGNVAHLLLARGVTRERELSLRVALGAGRGRLVRQLMTESLLLAGLGWLVGAALGYAGLRAIIASRPDSLTELDRAQVDMHVLGFALALALGTGLLFGLASVIQGTLRGTHAGIKAGAASAGGSRFQRRLRATLVITEMAVSSMLLVGAGLLVSSVMHLQSTDAGFNPASVYTLRPGLAPRAKRDPAVLATMRARLASSYGAANVASSQSAPPSNGGEFGAMVAEESPITVPTQFLSYNAVEPGYFRFLAIPFASGVTFTDSSATSTQVVVNQGFVHHYWPGRDGVGRRFRLDADQPWLTVVGVIKDVAIGGMTADRAEPMAYFPGPDLSLGETFLVRAATGINPLPTMRAIAIAADPHAPPPTVTRLSDAIAATLAQPRFTMLLLTLFAGLAVLLSAIGLYGVLAYAVAERTREIGIRVALGATRQNVVSTVLRSGLGLATVGAAVGLLIARATAHLMQRLLFGTPPTDARVYAAGGALMMAIAVVASLIPARRALAVDPMTAIRSD